MPAKQREPAVFPLTAGAFEVVPIDRLTHLVTDRTAKAAVLEGFKEAGLQVITA